MGLIISFISGTLGRLVLGGGAILAAWLFVKTYYEGKGAAKEVAAIQKRGETNARKARKIRRDVKKLSDDELIDHYFRD